MSGSCEALVAQGLAPWASLTNLSSGLSFPEKTPDFDSGRTADFVVDLLDVAGFQESGRKPALDRLSLLPDGRQRFSCAAFVRS